MKRFSEYVSPGHPDKIADYISQDLLDRYIEHDPHTRYAVEVQVNEGHIYLGGEITSKYTCPDVRPVVMDALRSIGYTEEYNKRWGAFSTPLDIQFNVKEQSEGIAAGVPNGWGDQGIFYGYANPNPDTCGMPLEHTLARRIVKRLYDERVGGIDIKAEVITNDGQVETVIVAVPLFAPKDEAIQTIIRNEVSKLQPQSSLNIRIIINGTGNFVKHGPAADCGTTGRKLVADFYGGGIPIGGGCPWTKDGTKADLTLNLLARRLALQAARGYEREIYTSIACCIGRPEVEISYRDADGPMASLTKVIRPEELIREYRLDTPIYASMCMWGLFGEFQQGKAWETITRTK